MVVGETGPLSLHVPSHVGAVNRHVKGNVIVLIRNMEEHTASVMITRLSCVILMYVQVNYYIFWRIHDLFIFIEYL